MVGDVQAQVAEIPFLTQNDLLQISFVYLSLSALLYTVPWLNGKFKS